MRANESRYAFYNRSGSTHIESVRALLESWHRDMPEADRSGIRGQIRSDNNHDFDSAFWEMYLYKLVSANGCRVEIHPTVPNTSKHPDFLVHDDRPYYLEAITIGQSTEKTSSTGRLSDVEAVLDEVRIDGFTLSFNWFQVGAQPLKATKLRAELLAWVDSLDRDSVSEYFELTGDLPDEAQLEYREPGDDVHLELPPGPDGERPRRWDLVFKAIPVTPGGNRLVSIRGPARAGGSNNRAGFRRALDSKANRYGRDLPHPLVIAVLSSAWPPIRDYDIQPELYGETAFSPAVVRAHDELHSEGHWRTPTRWRRSHAPHVVTGAGIDVYSMVRAVPRLWTTLEPGVETLGDLAWADPVDVSGTDPSQPVRRPDLTALGISADWMAGDPDFDD